MPDFTDELSSVFLVGAFLTDKLEGWEFVLFAAVIAFDVWIARKSKIFLSLAVSQIFILLIGYLWALSVARDQDVSGPYAWALVVGFWCIFAALTHVCTWVVVTHREKTQ